MNGQSFDLFFQPKEVSLDRKTLLVLVKQGDYHVMLSFQQIKGLGQVSLNFVIIHVPAHRRRKYERCSTNSLQPIYHISFL